MPIYSLSRSILTLHHVISMGLDLVAWTVQDQPKNVLQILQAFDILGGSVVTWSDASEGGDSGAVQDQLKDVRQIQLVPPFVTMVPL